jgi:hypothetical protein
VTFYKQIIVCAKLLKAVNNFLEVLSVTVVTVLGMTLSYSKLDHVNDIRSFRNMK